ncbi:polyribonucleotide nucleotidyltransferase [bacterium Unc6]|nr:polyribonucleotide nucleotidyltransferase [bacterium Unc6]
MATEKTYIAVGKKQITIETGRFAKQAHAAVSVQCGETVVLVTVVMSKEPNEDIDHFPLTVEFQEKTYAAGRIPGGFFKRESRPTSSEILGGRLTDRAIRPLFPKGVLNEVQVVSIVLSSDGENDPDVLSIIGASTALSISSIPFNGPVGAVRVGRIDDEFIINPVYRELEKSDIDVVVAGTKSGIIMLEAGGNQVSEDILEQAILFGQSEVLKIIKVQEEFVKRVGVSKSDVPTKKTSDELLTRVKQIAQEKLSAVNNIPTKEEREQTVDAICKNVIAKLTGEGATYSKTDVHLALIEIEKESVRQFIIKNKKRVDGRSYTDIRQISCEIGILPRTHGSALFTRGQTQSLSVTTLGTGEDEQLIERLEGETSERFILHYNFPPFSVGEVRPIRGPGRREIGHGALAEKALRPVMPGKEKFPYTVRVVSEILESNGSSSMATVCAGTLSLMDAGVPIAEPVAGVAMGLIKQKNDAIVLTDISGLEDHFGDMDFKLTGTKNGATALQMDLKIDAIDKEILHNVIIQAKQARKIVLDVMNKTILKPKEQISVYAPHITTFKIKLEKIGTVIGPSGKTIRKIIADTGVSIDIQDDGTVNVASSDAAASEKAINRIKSIIEEPQVGRVYTGKVKRVTNFGAFCEILPNIEGLVHVSELSDSYVKNAEDIVKVGDEITVKLIEIDKQGRLNLSKKAVLIEERKK